MERESSRPNEHRATLALAAFYVLLLAKVHAIWLAASWHYGYWVSYGHPESWSHWPMSELDLLGFMVLPLLLIFFGSPFAATWALIRLHHEGGLRARGWRAAAPLVLLVAAALVVSDPFGALNWYAD